MYLCAHHLLCINVHGLLQPAGNCSDDFNGCRTFYIAVLVQLIGDLCGEVDSANHMATSCKVLEAFCTARYDCLRLKTGRCMQNYD